MMGMCDSTAGHQERRGRGWRTSTGWTSPSRNANNTFVFSASETHLLLIPRGRKNRPATQEVVVTVTVGSGSLIHPFTLHTGDGTHVVLQPTRSDPAGPWVAQVRGDAEGWGRARRVGKLG